MKVSPDILSLTPYQPGKPISEAKREFGLKEVFKLASNENPLGPSPKVLAAIQTGLKDIHRYPDATGHEMVKVYADFLQVPKESVAFGNGSNELIDLLIRLYCEPGDAILTSKVAFVAYRIGAQAARVSCVETELSGVGTFDLHAMKVKLRENPKIRLVFIANPNNPTGTYLSEESLRDFLVEAQKYSVLVVLDEAYVEFVRAPDYASGLKLRKDFDNLVVLRTMSKAYGLAGLRVGFAVASALTVDLLNRIRNPFNVSSLAQVATVAALTDQAHVGRVLKETWKGLDFWSEELKRLQLPFLPSQGNFILVDTLRDSVAMDLGLLKQGIIFRPVRNYGLMNHLRISMGTMTENQAGLKAFVTALNSVAQA